MSSTFRDMEAERDHLARFVFPRLRDAFLERRIHLIDIDLRWGVTSDQDVVEACREIIQECQYFVCLLGERYGSTLPGQSQSITEQEIRYVALHADTRDARVFFYFRDAATTREMDEPEPGAFREPSGSTPACNLAALKDAITEAGFRPYVYRARWNAEQHRLTELASFGGRVFDDLREGIEQDVGSEDGAPSDEFEAESAAMEAVVARYTEHFVPGSREQVLGRLQQFALEDVDGGPCFLSGEAGSGKSALLAELAKRLKASPEVVLIPHFVGASAGSTSLRLTLRRLCREVGVIAAAEENVPQDIETLATALPPLLSRAAAVRRFVIIIDGLDQLEPRNESLSLRWLPYLVPPNARIIASARSVDSGVGAGLPERLRTSLTVDALTPADARAIVNRFLYRHGKRFTGDQMEMLLLKEDAHKPLYLLTALEELRTIGLRDVITRRIDAMPGEVRPLFRWTLTRLESEPEFAGRAEAGFRRLVPSCASGLAASRRGLALSELIRLATAEVGDPHQLSAIRENVAALERLLRPYLLRREGLLDFHHAQLREAVREQYFASDAEYRAVHGVLADLFTPAGAAVHGDAWQTQTIRTRVELPYHVVRSRRDQLLHRLLSDLEYLSAVCAGGETRLGSDGSLDHVGVFDLLALSRDLEDYLGQFEDDAGIALRTRVRRVIEMVLERVRLLRLLPQSLAQEAFNWSARQAATGGVSDAAWIGRRPATGMLMSATTMSAPARRGHTGDVVMLVAAASGRRFFSGGDDGVVGYWEVDSEDPIWLVGAHKGGVSWLAVSPDGHSLVSSGDEGRVLLWEVRTGSCATLKGETWGEQSQWPAAPFCAYLGDDTILFGRAGEWTRLAIRTGEELWRRTDVFSTVGRQVIGRCDFAPTANLLALGTDSGDIGVHDGVSGDPVSQLKLAGSIQHVAVSADGQWLLAADYQGRILAADPRSGRIEGERRLVPLAATCRSADSRVFFAYSQTGRLYRVSVGDGIEIEPRDTPALSAMVVQPPRTLLSVHDDLLLLFGRQSGVMSALRMDTGALAREWWPGGSAVMGAIFPQNTAALTIEGEYQQRAGRARFGRRVIFVSPAGRRTEAASVPHARPIVGCATPAPDTAVTVDRGGVAATWKNTRLVRTQQLEGTEFVACASWLEAGVAVAGTQEDEIIVFTAEGGFMKRSLPSTPFEEHPGVSALSARGRPMSLLVAYANGIVRMTGVRDWTRHGHAFGVYAAALDQSCHVGATGDARGEVVVWRCADGVELARLMPHEGAVIALAFDSSGRVLLSAGADGLLFVFDVGRAALVTGTKLPLAPLDLLYEDPGALRVLDAGGYVSTFVYDEHPVRAPGSHGSAVWRAVRSRLRSFLRWRAITLGTDVPSL